MSGCAACPYKRCHGCSKSVAQGGNCNMIPTAQGCCVMSIRASDAMKGCYWGEKECKRK